MRTEFDLIILGGGVVGLTLAAALQKTPLTIAIVDSHLPETTWDKDKFDLRVSAITRSSEFIFRHLNLWDDIIHERVSAYRKMQVWDGTGAGEITFNSAEIGEPNLGHIIENRVLRKALYEKLLTANTVEFIIPAKAEDIIHVDKGIIFQLADGRQLTTRLLVGADGAESWLRQRANFECVEKSYEHEALVATVTTELNHQQTARQIFLEEGVLAFLPLSDAHTCSIVWSTRPALAKELLAQEDDLFQITLAAAINHQLGKISNVSRRLSFPLIKRHVKNYVKPRIALMGDAAHTIHPLAGQGVNLGLLDAAALAEAIMDARQQQRDIGLLHCLRQYERARKGENTAMLLAMDGFKHLFDSQLSPVVWMRSLGLNVINKSESVKNLFVKKAMGIIGDVPKLAKFNGKSN